MCTHFCSLPSHRSFSPPPFDPPRPPLWGPSRDPVPVLRGTSRPFCCEGTRGFRKVARSVANPPLFLACRGSRALQTGHIPPLLRPPVDREDRVRGALSWLIRPLPRAGTGARSPFWSRCAPSCSQTALQGLTGLSVPRQTLALFGSPSLHVTVFHVAKRDRVSWKSP